MRKTVLAFALLLAAGAARAQTMTDAVFKGVAPAELSGRLAAWCMDKQLAVVEADAFHVVCEIPMVSITDNFVARSALYVSGSGHARGGEKPQRFVRFTLAPLGPDVRVQVREYYQGVLPNGGVKQAEVREKYRNAEVQAALAGLGAAAP